MNAFWINKETLETASNENFISPKFNGSPVQKGSPVQNEQHVEIWHEQTLPGRTTTVRFKKTSQNRPTEDELAKSIYVRCPRCHQNHEVVASRLQQKRPFPKRWMYQYLHCRVCDCRFKEVNPDGVLTVLFLLAALIVCPVVIAYCV
jgi:hypothetical protein